VTDNQLCAAGGIKAFFASDCWIYTLTSHKVMSSTNHSDYNSKIIKNDYRKIGMVYPTISDPIDTTRALTVFP
jgi:hypothetical protein